MLDCQNICYPLLPSSLYTVCDNDIKFICIFCALSTYSRKILEIINWENMLIIYAYFVHFYIFYDIILAVFYIAIIILSAA